MDKTLLTILKPITLEEFERFGIIEQAEADEFEDAAVATMRRDPFYETLISDEFQAAFKVLNDEFITVGLRMSWFTTQFYYVDETATHPLWGQGVVTNCKSFVDMLIKVSILYGQRKSANG